MSSRRMSGYSQCAPPPIVSAWFPWRCIATWPTGRPHRRAPRHRTRRQCRPDLHARLRRPRGTPHPIHRRRRTPRSRRSRRRLQRPRPRHFPPHHQPQATSGRTSLRTTVPLRPRPHPRRPRLPLRSAWVAPTVTGRRHHCRTDRRAHRGTGGSASLPRRCSDHGQQAWSSCVSNQTDPEGIRQTGVKSAQERLPVRTSPAP